MNHASLFSGIGGFYLAAEMMGWNNAFNCEINPFCQKVLKYYWPNAQQYDDIKSTDFSVWRGKIDIITGGFPCQPFSLAGKRKGTDDDRHLWPEMLRAIREIKPTWVVGENVFGIVNWSDGLVFEQVQADLENEGYEVQPYILPACGVNAPHKRYRVWFVAHSKCHGLEGTNWERVGKTIQPTQCFTSDTDSSIGCEGRLHQAERKKTERHAGSCNSRTCWNAWDDFPTQPPVRERNDGLPSGLVGITVSNHRNESIKAYGNAIVPQVALQIFKAIEQYNSIYFS